MRYFTSLLKENAKHRGWEIMLSVFAFVVILPIFFWLYLAKLDMDFSKTEMVYKAQQFADQYFREVNPWLIAVTIVLALVSGIRGMAFVFHKQENDFYHSLPVRREQLFFVSYVNTMLFYLVPFVVSMAMSVGIVKLYAPAVVISAGSLIGNMAVHFLAYFMMCNIHIFLVMVTGRTVMAVLGIVGTYLVGILYYYVGVLYVRVWFPCVPSDKIPSEILRLLCPPLNYISCSPSVTPEEYPMIFVMVIIGVISLLLAVLLYCRRPSEAAGTGIVYHGLKNVIKVVLNTLCGIIGTLLVSFLSYVVLTKFMLLNGIIVLLFFLVVGYVLLQLIVEQNIKTCKRDMPVLIISTGFAVFWIVFFQSDICKVNSYIPEQSEVESVSFAFTNDEDCEYRLAHMEYDDLNTVLTLAEKGLQESKGMAWLWGNGYGFSVCYHMKDGRDIRRNYIGAYTDEFKELITVVVDSEEYKQSAYVFGEREYDEICANLSLWEVNCGTTVSSSTDEEEQALLEALRKDLATVSLDEIADEATLGNIQLVLPEDYEDEYLNNNPTYGWLNSYGYVERAQDISYGFTKSYKNVIAVLEKYGYLDKANDTLLSGKPEKTVQIRVTDREENRYGVITDVEVIKVVYSLAGWTGDANHPADNTPYIQRESGDYGLGRYDVELYFGSSHEETGDIEVLPDSVLNAIIWED